MKKSKARFEFIDEIFLDIAKKEEKLEITTTLFRMTLVAAVITAVRLRICLFRFSNGVSAVGEFPEVLPVLPVRQKRTRRNMDLMVSVTLGILVYVVFSHRAF